MRAFAIVLTFAADAAASAQTHYWTDGPALLQARSFHALAVTNDALFALAGSGADLRPVGLVERMGDGGRARRTCPKR